MLYLLAGTEMVVDSIHLSWSGVTTVVKHERLQSLSQLRIKLGERFGERALPDARWSRKDNQASVCHTRSSIFLPVFCASAMVHMCTGGLFKQTKHTHNTNFIKGREYPAKFINGGILWILVRG